MASVSQTKLHDELTQIVTDYLGPAGPRFMDRQIRFHLKKAPEKVTKSDVPKLAEWIKVSMALLTNDEKIVDECIDRFEKLTS